MAIFVLNWNVCTGGKEHRSLHAHDELQWIVHSGELLTERRDGTTMMHNKYLARIHA